MPKISSLAFGVSPNQKVIPLDSKGIVVSGNIADMEDHIKMLRVDEEARSQAKHSHFGPVHNYEFTNGFKVSDISGSEVWGYILSPYASVKLFTCMRVKDFVKFLDSQPVFYEEGFYGTFIFEKKYGITVLTPLV